MTSLSYKAKELWITHNHTHLECSACELPHMHLFLPETECVYLKSVRLMDIDCFSNFLELDYGGLSLNFIKLVQLLIDGDVESNPGPTRNDCKSPPGHPKKIKVFKGTPKDCILVEQ